MLSNLFFFFVLEHPPSSKSFNWLRNLIKQRSHCQIHSQFYFTKGQLNDLNGHRFPLCWSDSSSLSAVFLNTFDSPACVLLEILPSCLIALAVLSRKTVLHCGLKSSLNWFLEETVRVLVRTTWVLSGLITSGWNMSVGSEQQIGAWCMDSDRLSLSEICSGSVGVNLTLRQHGLGQSTAQSHWGERTHWAERLQ